MTKTLLPRKRTEPQDIARIEAFFVAIQELMGNLFARWQDEAQYEDIAEYQAVITQKLPIGFKITRMTKRPFGFEFQIGTEALYAIRCTTTTYGWKRIA